MTEIWIKVFSSFATGLSNLYKSTEPLVPGFFLTKVNVTPQVVPVIKEVKVELWFIPESGNRKLMLTVAESSRISSDKELAIIFYKVNEILVQESYKMIGELCHDRNE